MTVDTIEIELADARSSDLIDLVAALDDFLNKVCGVERNHGSPIDRLAHDDTQMFIARIAGQAVGCAGLQVFEDGTGEVKRMYVATEVRQTGIGSRLLTRVVEAASTARVSVSGGVGVRYEKPPAERSWQMTSRNSDIPGT